MSNKKSAWEKQETESKRVEFVLGRFRKEKSRISPHLFQNFFFFFFFLFFVS